MIRGAHREAWLEGAGWASGRNEGFATRDDAVAEYERLHPLPERAVEGELRGREILDAACEVILEALRGGEPKIEVILRREVPRTDDPTVTTVEHVVVRGFECAHAETCGRPFHVFVDAAAERYEYPDHLSHR